MIPKFLLCTGVKHVQSWDNWSIFTKSLAFQTTFLLARLSYHKVFGEAMSDDNLDSPSPIRDLDAPAPEGSSITGECKPDASPGKKTKKRITNKALVDKNKIHKVLLEDDCGPILTRVLTIPGNWLQSDGLSRVLRSCADWRPMTRRMAHFLCTATFCSNGCLRTLFHTVQELQHESSEVRSPPVKQIHAVLEEGQGIFKNSR